MSTKPASDTAATDVPVPVSETATTDPTGTNAGSGVAPGGANNIPDGAHNTGAPADANDPLTGEDAAVVGEDPRTL